MPIYSPRDFETRIPNLFFSANARNILFAPAFACETGDETCIISNLVLHLCVMYVRTIVGDAERLVWAKG